MNKQNLDYLGVGLREGKIDSTGMMIGIVVVCGIVALAAANIFADGDIVLLKAAEQLTENSGDVFLQYLFIVVAVERAAAVYVGILRGRGRMDWAQRIKRLREVLDATDTPTQVLARAYEREQKLVQQLVHQAVIRVPIADIAGKTPASDDYRGYLTAVKHAYEFHRGRFDTQANQYVARIVFAVGIFLAAMGFSIFHDLLNPNYLAVASELQIGLIRFADILITGGLLGGGSAGLNFAASKVTASMNRN